MIEDNTHYLMACAAYIAAYKLGEMCKNLELRGYGISDLEFVNSKEIKINGIKYSYGEIDKIPIKENKENGLEKKAK